MYMTSCQFCVIRIFRSGARVRVVASWRSPCRDAVEIPRQMRGECWVRFPPPRCSEPISCTVVRPDREHFQEDSEGHGVQRQGATSSLRTGARAVAT